MVTHRILSTYPREYKKEANVVPVSSLCERRVSYLINRHKLGAIFKDIPSSVCLVPQRIFAFTKFTVD